MDSPSGQVFMNYAYSWGAAVVVLGTLFKLTHIQGANVMMFIGMGTEVLVFIISGFEKTYEKTSSESTSTGGPQIIVTGDGCNPHAEGSTAPQTIIATGYMPPAAGTDIPANQPGAPISQVALNKGEGYSIAAANLAAAGQAAAEAQRVLSQIGSGNVDAESLMATDPREVEEAVKDYAKELKELTGVLVRVKEQAARMSTDSEEMENLNRTLTGIATVYELQLRNISKQVTTIEQIDEQTRRMAKQIEELNNVYARMIQALTVNMNMAPATPKEEA